MDNAENSLELDIVLTVPTKAAFYLLFGPNQQGLQNCITNTCLMCRDSSQLKHIKLILITIFQAQTKEKAAFISLEQVDLKKKKKKHAIRKKKDNPTLWMQLSVNLDLYLKILFYSFSLRLASSKIEVHSNY